MRLATIKRFGVEKAAIITVNGAVLVEAVNKAFNKSWAENLLAVIESGHLAQITEWYKQEGEELLNDFHETIPTEDIEYGPLYRNPSKIWGIGLNYVEHASDLSEVAPNTEPASFMKPTTSIIGPGDTIKIPHQSERTTAEAELGIIIGKVCKNVTEEEAPNVIAGYTTIIDMTAEDILQRNPRYLTRSKSFDSFFSFGPQLVTPDEVDEVLDLKVATIINENLHRENVVANMTFQPWNLIAFHSQVMTLLPGDIISTGTPGAVVIRDGDIVSCHIEGFESLSNKVKDLKVN
ncbi:fumarylacetoacetate hydrolase family protein [Bacillus sp. PS06]|uniref:fumarylacetoacetate hydrolase family protein n=1 Tax=Bacillus sp. PS06 TaxID=2764176 RepID=UPI0017820C8E|nr:fumarylacetoacetate hydrolase family protein [Bacillus sp. PS06]MBD8067936.1 fumarylacetoacetate hydrolase family protein [Bacillus sp. PS06]